MTGCRYPSNAGIFAPRHRVFAGPGVHPVSYLMDTMGKAAGASN